MRQSSVVGGFVSDTLCDRLCAFTQFFSSAETSKAEMAHPTLMPSSISVGANLGASPTTNFAICLTFIRYFRVSWSCSSLETMIFVHLATCNGCSLPIRPLSDIKSHIDGGANPVEDSLIPRSNL
jgi:hypothetical protein